MNTHVELVPGVYVYPHELVVLVPGTSPPGTRYQVPVQVPVYNCKCVVDEILLNQRVIIRPLLTIDPNQNPKTYFWIGFGFGFGFGQLTQKRCYRFLGNPKCCQPPIYCDVGWQNHYKKSKIFLLDYFYKWNDIMIPIWEWVSFSRNLSDAAVLLSSNYTPVYIYIYIYIDNSYRVVNIHSK